MKIVSWNVAGLRACYKKGFSDFFYKENADIYCLQEVKAVHSEIPFNPEDYLLYLNPAEKKGYSGTCIYTKVEPLSVTYGMGIEEHDNEGRVITLEFNDFYLVTVYTPNVKRDLSRLSYRMIWEDAFKDYLKELELDKPVVVCGDLNVAHEEIDIKNAKANIGNAGFTYEERGKFTDLLNAGFTDTFRFINGDKIKYSWWSYIGHARESNTGWRIDYFLTSNSIKDKIINADILDNVMGSDHAPVLLEIDLK